MIALKAFWVAPENSDRLFTAAIALLVILLAAPGAWAAGSVNSYFGSFSTEIPISVPPYRGLEPKLGLTYSSSAGSSWVGMGWGLNGISFIERGVADGGAPRYDGGDVFRLDGMEMVPCTSQGGSYCTKIQNYARIDYDSFLDEWSVWGTNGNKATYEPAHITPKGTFRWLLRRVEDTRQNVVVYNSWCDGDDCYVDSIEYNQVRITFYREPRPDVSTFATGAGIGRTVYRLKSIDVTVSGERVRVYELGYTISNGTKRSMLTSVRQFGRDATLDSSGVVTGGTALPAMTFEWQDVASGDSEPFTFAQSLPGASTATQSFLDANRAIYTGDWDGDGTADMLHLHPNSNPIFSWVALSNGDGTFDFMQSLPGASVETSSYLGDHWAIYVGDWNGDGKSDLFYLHDHDDPKFSWVALSKGDGTFQFTKSLPGASPDTSSHLGNERTIQVGDWNGDGNSDLAYLDGNSNPIFSWVALSNGDGTFNFMQSLPGASTSTNSYLGDQVAIKVGDWNGDGRSDMLYMDESSDPNKSWVALSNGDGTFEFMKSLPGSSTQTDSHLDDNRHLQVGDWNGDGKTDLLYLDSDSDPKYSWVALSHGDGTFGFNESLPGSSTSTNSHLGTDRTIHVGDWNGDGRSDLLHLHPSSNPIHSWVATSNGDGTFDFRQSLPGASTDTSSHLGNNDHIKVGDWNGDGTTDILYLDTNSDPSRSWVALSNGPVPDLLARLENGTGGVTTIEYAPSSAWPNTYLLPGQILQTVLSLTTEDGRGNSSTTTYNYEGGLWSAQERRFLGFRRVTGVLDPQGNYTETFYFQRVGSTSKPEFTYLKDNTGRIFSYSAYEYTENVSPPFTSLLTERWDYTCNLTPVCLRTLVQFGYDEYANVIAAYEHGDYEFLGDERTTIRGYSPNLDLYITGLPAYENVYDGIGSGGALLQQVFNYYDANDAYDEPPTSSNLTKIEKWNSETGGFTETLYDYDQWGNVRRQVDERGSPSSTTFDLTHHLYPVVSCNALNQCATRTWDAVLGIETSTTDANGAVAEYFYDALGRTVEVIGPDGTSTEFEYLDWGDPTVQRTLKRMPDATTDGLWTLTYQDGLGRVYKSVDDGGIVKETVYTGATDRVWKESLAYASGETPVWIVYGYDGAGRLASVTNPDGTTAYASYGNDSSGKPFEVQNNELGHEKVIWRDAYGNLAQVREADGSSWHYTTYEYDMIGNPIRIVDAENNLFTVTWDSLGRKTSTCDVDMGCWGYSYDDGGLLVSQTDAKSQTIQFSYDELGRVERKHWPGSETNWYYDEIGYGASIGRLTRIVYPAGSESHTWDARGLEVASERCVTSTCRTIGRQYDALGRMSAMTYPDGETVSYSYDEAGRLSSVGSYVEEMLWTATGQLSSMVYSNGAVSTFSYDPDRLWLESALVNGPAGLLYEASYTYDPAARMTSMTYTNEALPDLALIFADGFESGDTSAWTGASLSSALRRGTTARTPASGTSLGSRTFTYDSLDRLIAVGGDSAQSITYDALGNIEHNSNLGDYAYGDAGHQHAVTTAGGQSYDYDANGSMLTRGGKVLTWNQENQLAAVTEGGETVSFEYDPDAQRIQKSGPSGLTKYFGGVAEEMDGKLVQYYFAGPVLVARKHSSEGLAWYHADHLGSTRVLTDLNGDKVKAYDYAAFGQIAGESGHAANERLFSGHTSDPETSLLYMGARYYDPELGRFISADSLVPDVANPQAFNRYSYVYNNPISNVDPTGHAPVVGVVMTAVSIAGASASTWVTATAVIGAGLSVAGYATKDPVLSAVGGIMLGFAGGYVGGGWIGGLLGGAEEALKSPLNPLDPEITEAISWIFSSIGTLKSPGESGGLGLLRSELQQASSKFFSKHAAHYADKLGLETWQLNLALTTLSFVGNEVAGSRYRVEDGIDTIFGIFQRSGGLFSNAFVSVPFDLIDIVLAYQGLPTAPAYEYIINRHVFNSNHKRPLRGFSLGAADVNNLAGYGLGGTTTTAISLPAFLAGSPGVEVVNGNADLVNGFVFGWVMTPGSRLISSGVKDHATSDRPTSGYYPLLHGK